MLCLKWMLDNDWWDTMPDNVKADVEAALIESEKGQWQHLMQQYKRICEMDCQINWTNRAWRTYRGQHRAFTESMDSKRNK